MIDFDTTPFIRSHMKAPRGYGSWAFSVNGGEPWFAPTSTYTDAKKAAAAHFKGWRVIQVMP